MATKKSWFSNVKVKKKEPKVVEKPVTTVEENEQSVAEVIKEVKSEALWEIVWNWQATFVKKPVWRIKFEAVAAAYPMFKLPPEIRRYLQSRWLGTNVWKKDKEWLERHNVDLEMVEKLKRFLTWEL